MTLSIDRTIVYPDQDGQPMSDNTKQFRWIVLLKENLDWLFADHPDVFIAGDLLWYPVEGSPEIRVAPDAMVVFGRPKGDRGSYRQWKERDVPPQVVFEVLSPGNTYQEMRRKLKFYDRHGVEEYYVYDPDDNELTGFVRSAEGLTAIADMNDWISPRLGIRFAWTSEELAIYGPNGQRFLTTIELVEEMKQEQQRADLAERRAEQEYSRAEQERDRADRLAARLRELGIEE
jgi:Uma2 family endonuclease